MDASEPKKFTLRPYQKEAVASAIEHFKKQRTPAVVVLPTGAGKSLVIAELAKIARGSVLILAHVRELVEQNHSKYESYGLSGGIYSAGLSRKDHDSKVTFGSIQSVARAPKDFFQQFSLLIIDECHRVSHDEGSQYQQVIQRLKLENPSLCILGLTATPYRLGIGWIYQYHAKGCTRTNEERFFKKCIYELPLSYMIKNKFLTQPIKIDSPVAGYDFSQLKIPSGGSSFRLAEIESTLKDQSRVTPGIVQNIVEMSGDRAGIMIFTSSIRHAEEILGLLPLGQAALVVGETHDVERDIIIRRFKNREIKFLVNVSVLTTGFDAPHVDLIAILRPTESASLYQQIVGRGLRLSDGKTDCLVLDYTGQGHNIFSPQIDEDKPSSESVPVKITCPECTFINDFWGYTTPEGEVIEHFGRKCKGATESPDTLIISQCSYRFRFKYCDFCGSENDIAARICCECDQTIVDTNKKLKDAMSLKGSHVMRPDSMTVEKGTDRKGQERLEVKYYDNDGEHLSEYFYIGNSTEARGFYYHFIRLHARRPEKPIEINSIDDVFGHLDSFRIPIYLIAMKKKYYWQIREKIFE